MPTRFRAISHHKAISHRTYKFADLWQPRAGLHDFMMLNRKKTIRRIRFRYRVITANWGYNLLTHTLLWSQIMFSSDTLTPSHKSNLKNNIWLPAITSTNDFFVRGLKTIIRSWHVENSTTYGEIPRENETTHVMAGDHMIDSFELMRFAVISTDRRSFHYCRNQIAQCYQRFSVSVALSWFLTKQSRSKEGRIAVSYTLSKQET